MRFTQNILLIIGLFTCNQLFAQNRIIRGTVIDLDGFPIIGTEVMVENKRTSADLEGCFSLSIEPGERLISFRMIGYIPITLALPDSLDTEMTVYMREDSQVDFFNDWLEQKSLSYYPNVSFDLPDVYRIKVHTGRYIPIMKVVRMLYSRNPYYAPVSIIFEDKNGNTIYPKESKKLYKRLKMIPFDIIEIEGFVRVWTNNSYDTPATYCYERKVISAQ